MYLRQIIKDIEIYFSRYCESTSDTMLYYTTKHLLDFLNSFDIVKVILINLKNEYPYDKNAFEQSQNGFEIIKHVAQCKKQYVSFVLHFLEYSYTTDSIEVVLSADTHEICCTSPRLSHRRYTCLA